MSEMLPIMSKIDFRKNLLNLSNLIQLIVSIISHYSQRFICRFSDFFLIKRLHLKNLWEAFSKGVTGIVW